MQRNVGIVRCAFVDGEFVFRRTCQVAQAVDAFCKTKHETDRRICEIIRLTDGFKGCFHCLRVARCSVFKFFKVVVVRQSDGGSEFGSFGWYKRDTREAKAVGAM